MTNELHDLAEAEPALRKIAERTDWWVASQAIAVALRTLLAEYDRRGEVERLADSVVKAEQDAARELEAENATLRMQLADLMAAVERGRREGAL